MTNEGMTVDERQALAERATEIFNADDVVTYSQAIDQAMVEANPGGDPAGVERLFQALLNVAPEPPVLKRHQNKTAASDSELV